MEKVQRLPIYPCTHACIDFPIINIPHQSVIFTTIDESILAPSCHPKPIVYITVHS